MPPPPKASPSPSQPPTSRTAPSPLRGSALLLLRALKITRHHSFNLFCRLNQLQTHGLIKPRPSPSSWQGAGGTIPDPAARPQMRVPTGSPRHAIPATPPHQEGRTG